MIKSVMFICLGNICRSPMAEYILKDKLKKAGMNGDFVIRSAATSNENVWNGHGSPVYPPAKRKLLEHAIVCDDKRAVQLKKDDYSKYDLFVCMDDSNIRNSIRIFGGDPENKLCKLMDFTDTPGNVADPWYTDDFDAAYNDINKGCECLLNKLKQQ